LTFAHHCAVKHNVQKPMIINKLLDQRASYDDWQKSFIYKTPFV